MKMIEQIRILFLCLPAVLSPPVGCHGAENKNEQKAVKIDRNTPLDVLQAEVKKNNPDAMCQLAMRYGSGSNGCEVDEEKAFELYRKASKYADQGIASAQYCLGVCYFTGDAGEQDIPKALRWFRKSAEQDFFEAQMMLAIIYEKGMIIVAPWHEEAVKWLRRAAESGHSEAQFLLGVWYCTGTCVPKDIEEGYKWFSLVTEQGLPEAKEAVGQFKVTAKTESKWAGLVRKIPDSTGILNAMLDGNLAKVKELIQNNPSLLKKTFGDNQSTLLHIASVDCSVEVLKYLIEQNADISAKDNQNWTPIAYAGWAGNHEAIRHLLANGSREPHENCLDLPGELERLVRRHAVATGMATSHVVRTEYETRKVGDYEVEYKKDYYGPADLSGTKAIVDQLFEERGRRCQLAMVEIAKAKSGKDLKKYVLKRP